MQITKRFNVPFLGFGLGLRAPHHEELLSSKKVDWLEVISENFMLDGGQSPHSLAPFKERYTIIPHGVSLSVGSVDTIDKDHLKKLKKLINYLNPPWFSDHLCWAGLGGAHMHNLLPLPYTEETITYVAQKIALIQDAVGIPFLIENLSSYIEFKDSQMTEWEFLKEIAETADCGILLDVNNVYVSSRNHHFDPMTYIQGIPADRVVQYHIAGHQDHGTYVLDTHDHPVRDEVWDLFSKTVPLMGNVSTMIERDDNIPPFNDLLAELEQAKSIYQNAQLQNA
jgi:uncharacterized protein (UPF0276 family)